MPLGHIINILRRFDIEPKSMDRILDSYYRSHENLGPKERKFISDTVFGIMRWKRHIEGIFSHAGVKKPAYKEFISAYLLWRQKQGVKLDGDLSGIVRDIPIKFEIPISKFPGGPSAYFSFPQFIYDILIQSMGSESTHKLLMALNEPADIVIRTNIMKIGREELQKALKEEGIDSTPTKYSPFGLILKERVNFNALNLFKEGFFEVQEEASQLIGLLTAPKAGELVIDLCAGAGGKTLLLAMLLKNKGRIIASDRDEKKLNIIKRRARRAGISNITILSLSKLIKEYKGKADVLLIDAPCSGTGTLRRNPDIKWRIKEKDIMEYVKMQKELLIMHSSLVKKGGRLIYATCSILPNENEEVAKWFLGKYKFDWKLINAAEKLDISDREKFISPEGYFKSGPSSVKMDGFFAFILQRI